MSTQATHLHLSPRDAILKKLDDLREVTPGEPLIELYTRNVLVIQDGDRKRFLISGTTLLDAMNRLLELPTNAAAIPVMPLYKLRAEHDKPLNGGSTVESADGAVPLPVPTAASIPAVTSLPIEMKHEDIRS